MARLLRRGSPEFARRPHCAPVVNPGAALSECDSFEHQLPLRTSVTLHSPSSWQTAQKLRGLSPSKLQSFTHRCTKSSASVSDYGLHAESFRTVRPRMPSDLPATPNAVMRMQRAATPKPVPSLPTPTRSRPSTAAGTSLPPHNKSARSVPSVEFFAASGAAISGRHHLHCGPDGLERIQQPSSPFSVIGRHHSSTIEPKAAPTASNGPIIKFAASVYDSSLIACTHRDPALGSLQQELSELQAHRAMELHRFKAATQRPPANLLMRQRNLPEAEPNEKGLLELSLRNR
jgi:hypothetical protein